MPRKLQKKERLASLDILRGADLFLLLVITPIVHTLADITGGGGAFFRQFTHTPWAGFTLYDIIMPLFLFMSGITIPFSMARFKEGDRPDRLFYLRLLKRFCLLFFLGWIVQGNLLSGQWRIFHPYANTLQSIAVGYVVTALLFVRLEVKWQMVAGAILFGTYWAVFALFGGMDLTPDGNIALSIDNAVLGSHRGGVLWAADGSWSYHPNYHYAWILPCLNFAVTVLLGCFAGQLLRSRRSPVRKAAMTALAGIGLVAAGLAMAPAFPIIKKIWSGSMVLFSGGICFLLIALTYWMVDVKGWNKGLGFLKWFGMNSIAAYCIGEVIVFDSISESLLFGFSGWTYYPLLVTLGNVSLLTVILWLMHRRSVYLKV